MIQSLFRRIVTAVTLAAALTVAAPVHAATRWEPPAAAGVLEQVWRWLAGFLPGEGERERTSRATKRGGAIDPNGATSETNPPLCASPAELERSGCIDPNG